MIQAESSSLEVMSKQDHKQLVLQIQQLHASLRRAVQRGEDVDTVWDKHCKDQEKLNEYAASMHRLATVHWEENNTFTRINWCYELINNYFFKHGLKEILDKRRKQVAKFDLLPCPHSIRDSYFEENIKDKLLLLDVGSCYNPFRRFKELETVAIDICPANQAVHRCDFLKLDVKPMENWTSKELENRSGRIDRLPEGTFHVVVFSLLLEYLPVSRQRWDCCVKARKLLRPNGLLLVVSPDSKHRNKNGNMIRSWTTALEHVGLLRVRYDKEPHLHCLAFRAVEECCRGTPKDGVTCRTLSCKRYYSRRRFTNDDELGKPSDVSLDASTCRECIQSEDALCNMMYIPQDFNCDYETGVTVANCRREDDENMLIKQYFEELPVLLPNK